MSAIASQKKRLVPLLNHLCQISDSTRQIKNDPIEFPHRYADPRDIEVVAWLSSTLAYGQVALFKATIEKILQIMGTSPYRYLCRLDPKRERPQFDGIYYRFATTEDIFCLVVLMSEVVKRYGTVGELFGFLYVEEGSVKGALAQFVRTVSSLRPVWVKREITQGLCHLFPDVEKGSACKRFNLFLRWMVRPKDGMDFGLWKTIPPAALTIPLDTHIHRISGYLGLTHRKTADWKTAEEITSHLRRFDPVDPLRYDFALCHLGISDACPIKPDRDKCVGCPLVDGCHRGWLLTSRFLRKQPIPAYGSNALPALLSVKAETDKRLINYNRLPHQRIIP